MALNLTGHVKTRVNINIISRFCFSGCFVSFWSKVYFSIYAEWVMRGVVVGDPKCNYHAAAAELGSGAGKGVREIGFYGFDC